MTQKVPATQTVEGVTAATVTAAASAASAAQTSANTALTQALTASTAQATTSGTSFDFTAIPSWVRRITICLSGMSNVSGLGSMLIQIGSGSIDTTGYNSAGTYSVTTNNVGSLAATNGFLAGIVLAASTIYNGVLVLTHMGGNVWIATGTGSSPSLSGVYANSGLKTLSGVLDRIRLTQHVADTFDAGSVNIIYE
jgi:hypothetical protein